MAHAPEGGGVDGVACRRIDHGNVRGSTIFQDAAGQAETFAGIDGHHLEQLLHGHDLVAHQGGEEHREGALQAYDAEGTVKDPLGFLLCAVGCVVGSHHIYGAVQQPLQQGFLIANVDRLIDNGSGQPETMEVATEQKKVKFSNAKIILPDTGGTGPLPYLAVGTLLISAAFALPLIRRRKEDECDS